jgi:glycosyltransferase involved in cell wall biosynthesis
MIIAIDGNEANVGRRVGIGEYAFELLNQFSKLDRPEIKFIIYLKSKPLIHMPKESSNWRYKVVGPSKLWTQFGLPLSLFTSFTKPNIFFTPSHYSPRFCPIPRAMSIMDLSYVKFPELFNKDDLYQLVNWTKYSALKASRVFTISGSSRDDIIKEYKVKPENVVVTYPGIKMDIKASKSKFDIDGQYILFVGTLQPRKNIVRLVEAFSRLNEKDLKLLIVGKKGWQYEEIINSPKTYDVQDRVKFLDYVSDEELPALYKNALCFCLPSLYEGFGLPVLESMKYGCPVAISNTSSLPEVGGEAALYFDPENTDDITRALEELIQDKKKRESLIKKGYEQIKKFSWEKTANETLKVLENLANER